MAAAIQITLAIIMRSKADDTVAQAIGQARPIWRNTSGKADSQTA